MKTFLICHRGALGDFLLTWPALASLRAVLPDYRFLGVGRPAYLRLARSCGIVDFFLDMEGPELHRFFAGTHVPPALGSPDGAVLWLTGGEETARLIGRNATLPVALIPPFPDRPIHVALHHCLAVRKHFPVHFSSPLVPYFPWKTESTDLVLVHPGSGSRTKNYPPVFSLRLVEELHRAGFPEVAFLLGPVEMEQGLDALLPGQRIITPADLAELGHAVAGCLLYIGNDSGPSHLAGLVGTRTMVFYRTTAPAVWGVLGRRVSHITGTDEDEAFAAFARRLHHDSPDDDGRLFFP